MGTAGRIDAGQEALEGRTVQMGQTRRQAEEGKRQCRLKSWNRRFHWRAQKIPAVSSTEYFRRFPALAFGGFAMRMLRAESAVRRRARRAQRLPCIAGVRRKLSSGKSCRKNCVNGT